MAENTMKQRIIEVSDLLYQGKIDEAKKEMPGLVQMLSKEIIRMEASKQQALLPVFQSIMQAMEQEEYMMLADMLVFEILDEL